MNNPQSNIFVVGGPVQAGSGGVYLERPADQELFELCLRNEYAYVLTPRQMGKSSLMNHTQERLKEKAVNCAIVDLSRSGSNATEDQWYIGILSRVVKDIKTATFEDAQTINAWWQQQSFLSAALRFTQFFEDVLLNAHQEPIVVFLDEIDTTLGVGVQLYSDDFFAAIRALHTARANNSALKRLSFVLIGVATPNELINDPKRTPFNIGHNVDLTDFTLEQAKPLAAGFGLAEREAVAALGYVLKWTGGHPYLTQRLCRLIAESGQTAWGEKNVDELVQNTYFSEQGGKDNNLVFVRNMLTERISEREKDVIIGTYRDIRRGDLVPDEERSLVKSHLKISGLVRAEGGLLRVRNAIYAKVFDEAFIDQHLGEESARRALQAANERVAEERRQKELEQRGNVRLSKVNQALVAALAGIGVIVAGSLIWQTNEWARVTKIDQAAAIALGKIEGQYDQALLIGNAANRSNDDKATRDALLRTIQASRSNLNSLLIGHTNNVTGVAFSPDGKILASASYDKTIRLWDVSSHKEIAILEGHTDTGHTGHTDTIWRVAFSPDGKTLASASWDKTIRLWDVSSHNEIATLEGHTAAVRGVAFSPDGRLLASASEDNTVRLWNVLTHEPIGKLEHSDEVYSVAFSPNGKTLASGSGGPNPKAGGKIRGIIRLWNVTSRKPMATLKGHTGLVSSVTFSPNGKILASGSYDATVRLWDVSSDKPIGQPLRGHSGDVDSVAFSPDGKTLVSSGMDKTIRLWNVTTGESQNQPITGHAGIVIGATFSPDGTMLASGSFDRSVRLWGLNQKPTGKVLDASPTDPPYRVELSPTANLLAVVHQGGTLQLLNSNDGKPIQDLQGPLNPKTNRVQRNGTPLPTAFRCAGFSPDGKTLAAATEDQTIQLFTVSGGKFSRELKGHTDVVNAVVFSPDGKTLASASDDQTIRLWNTETWESQALKGHTDRVWDLAFSHDGKTLASASFDQTIRLWNASDGKLIRELKGHTATVLEVAFNPDGNTLASASADQTIRLWNTNDGKLIQELKGHTNAVGNVAFGRDGKTIISASTDGTIRLWNANDGQFIQALYGQDPIDDLSLSRDGKTLVSANKDGTIGVLDLSSETSLKNYSLESWRARACSIVGRNLTQKEWKEFFGNLAYQTSCPEFQPGP
jgi:WD40 repeat protein